MRHRLLALAAMLHVAPAMAAPQDGDWSVHVVTESGACGVYRLPIRIHNGQIIGPNIQGGVEGDGSVKVSIASRSGSAGATGHLSESAGRGRWTAPGRQCSGRWEAERRD